MKHRTISWRNNSTNVRALDVKKRFLHWSLAAAWRLAPQRTARAVKDLFFAPDCHPLSAEAAAWLERGRPFRIRVGDATVHGWQWGQGPGILFVHGWNGRAAHFAPFFAPLLEAGFSVTAFDAPGHGLSDGKTSSYFQITEAVRTLMRTGSGTRLSGLVGHSLGGAAVIGALSRENTKAAPVLIAPALDLENLLFSAFEGFGIPGPVYSAIIADYERRHGYSLKKDNPIRLLPDLKKRILIIHDRSDPTTPYLESRRAAEQGEAVRLHTTEGLGHKRILTDPEVVRLVVGHLKAQKESWKSTSAKAISSAAG